MKRATILGIGASLTLLLAADPAAAKSPLIDFKTGESLVTNLKARKVGDLLTIDHEVSLYTDIEHA